MMPLRRNGVLQEQAPLHVGFPGAGFAAPVAASGSITCGTNTAATDGDSVTIGDGINAPVTYEYDKSSNGVTAGHVTWAAGTTADNNSLALQALIQAHQPTLTVVDNGSGVLTLTHNWPGTGGNVTITKSGTGAVSAVTGMSGGLAAVATAITATTDPVPFHSCIGALDIDKIQLVNLGTTLATDDTNYFVITVQDGATVLGTWSTKTTGGNGALTANTFVTLAPGATRRCAAGDVLSYTITLHGSATMPGGKFVIHSHYVEATQVTP